MKKEWILSDEVDTENRWWNSDNWFFYETDSSSEECSHQDRWYITEPAAENRIGGRSSSVTRLSHQHQSVFIRRWIYLWETFNYKQSHINNLKKLIWYSGLESQKSLRIEMLSLNNCLFLPIILLWLKNYFHHLLSLLNRLYLRSK